MADLLPTFLVIGAMKAGTTSLCRDLAASPGIYFPSVKEPHTLCYDQAETARGRKQYAALFRKARPDQQRGEGSTGYTKRPGIDGVASRARRVLGSDLRFVYIVRNPIDRLLSHHRHLVRGGDAPADLDDALRLLPELIDVSAYAMQLDPWIDEFGLDHIQVIRFEAYRSHRRETVAAACQFLGAPSPAAEADFQRVHNAAEEALVPPVGLRGFARGITRSQFYKRVVHPRTPPWMRDRFKSTFYHRPAAAMPEVTPATRAALWERLGPDVERLCALLGWDELTRAWAPQPLPFGLSEPEHTR